MTITTTYLDRLQTLYATGYQNEFVEVAMQKIVARQVAQDEADLKKVQAILSDFERQYAYSSIEFKAQFERGEVADTADFMEWYAHCQMQTRILQRLIILQDE
ncbi:MAG: hypothetical protein KDD89_03120 [Anaerolineales bacterium]|nr:hypothetical protein [Anaerolineales bacterium]